MLRSALVAIDGSPHATVAATLAIDWAARFRARLLGLGVLDEPSIRGREAVPLGGGAFKQARDDARVADAHHRILGILAEFRARCAEKGVRADVVEDVGESAHCIVREAQRCDIVVLGAETHFHFETQEDADATLGQVLRQSPRPVVVVPRRHVDGHGVMVAYGGGREVARTLQTVVLLGLAGTEAIDVVTIRPDLAEAESVAALAGRFLASHEAPHRLHPLASGDPPAEVLLQEVRRRRPRLLVMGAQGHHPVRDLFGTSVTRAVLARCPVPVLVGA
jgi:nucleotide-binding universal stress UspA family protein